MHITVDASNLRSGGGVTHLQEILQAVDLEQHGVDKMTVWAPTRTLNRIGNIPRVVRKNHELMDKGRFGGAWFRKRWLDSLIDHDTDLLWVPGGTYLGNFRSYVTMAQSLLPFDVSSRTRYRYSWPWVRLKYLFFAQSKSFKRAQGLIHITEIARAEINRMVNLDNVRQVTIHHGLNSRFVMEPRPQRPHEEFTKKNPVRLLYVSPINHYKHQDVLIDAVAKIRAKGLFVDVDLVGSAYRPAKRKFDAVASRLDPQGKWIHWHREVSYADVHRYYFDADIIAYMSSCEAFGMILLESMASGVPILCSNRSAIPEINGGTCPEVDPEDVDAVANGLERLIRDKDLRERCSKAAYERAKTFTWKKCADQTFSFLVECANRSNTNL